MLRAWNVGCNISTLSCRSKEILKQDEVYILAGNTANCKGKKYILEWEETWDKENIAFTTIKPRDNEGLNHCISTQSKIKEGNEWEYGGGFKDGLNMSGSGEL